MKHNDPMGGITMRHKALALSGSVCLIIVLALLLFTPALAKSNPSADKIEIQIYSNPFGHTTYVLSFALAEILKVPRQIFFTCKRIPQHGNTPW